jgi:hypothetical protein
MRISTSFSGDERRKYESSVDVLLLPRPFGLKAKTFQIRLGTEDSAGEQKPMTTTKKSTKSTMIVI